MAPTGESLKALWGSAWDHTVGQASRPAAQSAGTEARPTDHGRTIWGSSIGPIPEPLARRDCQEAGALNRLPRSPTPALMWVVFTSLAQSTYRTEVMRDYWKSPVLVPKRANNMPAHRCHRLVFWALWGVQRLVKGRNQPDDPDAISHRPRSPRTECRASQAHL